jgi:hypothetical protein
MKPIEGFEDYYVDELGNIWSTKFNKNLKIKTRKDSDGYLMITLHKDGKRYTKKVHRLIAIAFIPNPEKKKTVNHKNCIKTDNRVENLEWCTYLENMRHAFDNGLMPKKENHWNSKITLKQVNEIRNDNRTHREIALFYNISRSHVSSIKKYHYWK